MDPCVIRSPTCSSNVRWVLWGTTTTSMSKKGHEMISWSPSPQWNVGIHRKVAARQFQMKWSSELANPWFPCPEVFCCVDHKSSVWFQKRTTFAVAMWKQLDLTHQSGTVLKGLEIANSQWKDVSIACNTRTSHCHKMFSFVLAQNAQCLHLFWSVDNMFQLKCKNGFISKHQQCVKPKVADVKKWRFTVKQNHQGFFIWSTLSFFEQKKFIEEETLKKQRPQKMD